MNKAIKNLLIFASGAALGYVIAGYKFKAEYEQIMQEDCARCSQNTHESLVLPEEEARQKADEAKEKDDILAYASKIRNNGYTDYSAKVEVEENTEEEEVDDSMGPYVISPEDFGELGYSEVNLTFFSDGVLADMDDEMVEDVEGTIGFNSLNQFGKYEDDAVHVRDDRLKIDYEILKDRRTYAEAMKYRPSSPREE